MDAGSSAEATTTRGEKTPESPSPDASSAEASSAEASSEEPRRAKPPRLDDVLSAATPSLARRLAPWLTVVALMIVASAGAMRLASIEKPVLVDVVSVSPGEVERTVASVSAGRVASRRRSRVSSPIVGRITQVLARKGDSVKEGQVIITLDASEAQANLGMASSATEGSKASVADGEATLLMAKSQLEQARAAVDEFQAALSMARSSGDALRAAVSEAETRLSIAKGEYDRRKKLDKGILSPEAVDRSEKEVASAESMLAASKARVQEAEGRVSSTDAQLREARAKASEAEARVSSIDAQLSERRSKALEARAHEESIKALLDKHTIKAPFSGVISELWVEVGEVTSIAGGMPMGKGGDPTGARLFELIDMSDLYVTAPVDEVDLARVQVGQEARVTLDPYPHEPFVGKVVRVAPYVLDVEDQNRTVEVEVAIPAEWLARGLKPGTSADVEVVVERRSQVPRLPANVLLDGKRALVVEPGPGGELRAVEHDLDVGIDNWRYAEIKGGLPTGAKVIAGAEGDAHVKPGMRVEVRKTIEPTGEGR